MEIIIENLTEYSTIYKKVRDFIGLDIPEAVFEAVATFFPQIVNYVEEDRTISFKMAIGANKVTSPYEYGDFCWLKNIPLGEKRTDQEERILIEDIKKAIKNIIPFCNTFTNVLIRFDSENKELYIGLYTANQDTFRHQEEFLLTHGYIILAPEKETGIIVIKKEEIGLKDKVLYLPLDLGFKNRVLQTFNKQPIFYSKRCRGWDGLFERVRKEVHGTICLIVQDSYKIENDLGDDEERNFTKGTSVVSVKNILDSNYKMELFLSMLNYDGITVINTKGDVLAYHVTSKISTKSSAPGGARHQAYEYLKDNKRDEYVGVYFQSQEGEIKFFEYNENDGDEKDYFDCTIMMPDKVDSDFVERLNNKIIRDASRISSISDRIEMYKDMTSLLCDYFNYSEKEIYKVEDWMLSKSRPIRFYSFNDWMEYLSGEYFLNTKLLKQLKEPRLSLHDEKLREWFELAYAREDDYDAEELFVSLHMYMLDYNWLQYEDMYRELNRRKSRLDWDVRLNELY